MTFRTVTSDEIPHNDENTPVDEISAQLREPRPLALGMKDFDQWFERIWSGALIPAEPGQERKLYLSCKATAADSIPQLGILETHKPDFYFINRLRKFAANQIAIAKRNEAAKELQEIFDLEKKALEQDQNKVT